MSEDIRELLCNGSDNMIDAAMHPLIRKWSQPEKAVEVLEVLDHCIHGGLASGFVVSFLKILYNKACERENTTHEEVLKSASWRTEWGQKYE